MEDLEEDPGAEARYRALASADPEGLVKALYDASWRVRRAAADALARGPAHEAVASRLIEVLGDRGQTGARNAAAAALGGMGPAATAPLLELLRHADPDQRKLAADILGERRDAAAIEALERAVDDADPNVRGAAAEALGRIGGVRAARVLLGLLDAKEPLVQACALDALFALKRPPPLPRLLPLLEQRSTARVAYRLLGLVDHPAARARVSAAVRDAGTREASLIALGVEARAWPADAEAALKAALEASPDVVAWLKKELGHSEQTVRLGALRAAAALKAPALAPAVARGAEDVGLAEEAARTLNRLGLYGALALLETDSAELLTMGPEARAVASEAIMRVGEPVLVPHLTRLLSSGDPELAEMAARALGRCRTAEAIAPLVDALEQEDALASAAGRALARIGASFPHQVVAALESVAMRPHVLRALVRVDPARAAAAVREAAHDSDEAMRAVAVEAAATLGVRARTDDAEATPSGSGTEPSRTARGDGTAAATFGRSSEEAAADSGEPLTEPTHLPTGVGVSSVDVAELVGRGLGDEAAMVRRAAARALPRLERDAALPLLSRALQDRDPSVLAAACDAVAVLDAPDVDVRVDALTGSADGFVVIASLNALAAGGVLSDVTGARALVHSDPEVVKTALALLADRAFCAAHASTHLRHARWDVRIAAARALEVSADAQALGAVRAALAVESDRMAKEVLESVAQRLAER
jgi:HEAT repeat protein